MANKNTKKPPQHAKSKKPNTSQKNSARQQAVSDGNVHGATARIVPILLACLTVLFFLFAIIPGQNVWFDIHNFFHGLFGFVVYIVPLYLLCLLIYACFKKISGEAALRFVCAGILLLLFAATIDVFGNPTDTFVNHLSSVYESAAVFKGGIFGALLGWPMVKAFGVTCSAIVLIVLMLTVVLIISGKTLKQFVTAVSKPAKKAKETTEEHFSKKRAEELEKSKKECTEIIENDPLGPAKSGKRKPKSASEPIDETLSVENPDEITDNAEDVLTPSANDDSQDIDEIIKRLRKETQTDEENTQPENTENSEAEISGQDDETEESSESDEDFEVPEDEEEIEYIPPSTDLLDEITVKNSFDQSDELKTNADLLINTFKNFGVEVKMLDICPGPTVTRYELQPAAGVRISKITGLADDIALSLATAGVRIEAPIPNKSAIGIEVPNKEKTGVSFREIVESSKFVSAKGHLTVGLGKDIVGNVIVADVSKMPHVLIAGTTGAGKSVCVNSMIMSILYKSTPDEVKFLMIDPKVVELQEYNGIPHLLVPVVTNPRKAAGALGWAVTEMLRRYETFSGCNVRDIESYNNYVESQKDVVEYDEDGTELDKPENLPHIVVVIDELSDLMMAAPNEVEDSICRVAQMGRAAGIHLVVATQRPSVDVITGLIKANIPSRIALKTSNAIDSRTIIDTAGAEKLLGRGDMLFFPVGSNKPIRVQGCWVSPEEIGRVISFLKDGTSPQYSDTVEEEISTFKLPEKGKKSKGFGEIDETDSDELLNDAVDCIIDMGEGSISMLQRKLKIGHGRAGRIMDILESMGIVGPYEGSKSRKVLITKDQWYEMKNQGNDPASQDE